MLSFLDDDDTRTQVPDGVCALDHIVLAGKVHHFQIVNDNGVHAFQHLLELVARNVDPKVHGVERDKFRRGLFEHFELKRGVDVAEEKIFRVARRFRELGVKVFEYIQLRVECVAQIDVIVIVARPAEGLSVCMFEAVEIDPLALKQIDVLDRKIYSNDPNQMDLRIVRGGERKKYGRTAEPLYIFTGRGIHRIQRD